MRYVKLNKVHCVDEQEEGKKGDPRVADYPGLLLILFLLLLHNSVLCSATYNLNLESD